MRSLLGVFVEKLDSCRKEAVLIWMFGLSSNLFIPCDGDGCTDSTRLVRSLFLHTDG